jgi:hypothetical protein
MFTKESLEASADACHVRFTYTPTDTHPLEDFADHLNGTVKTFMPQGAPSLTLSVMQAELIRDILAPNWAMQSIKIAAFEALAHLPLYAKQFGTKQAYDEITAAREALAQMNYILSSLTMHQPVVETNQFIQFLRDPQTKIVAPLYNHLLALQYAEKLARAWQQIPVFAPGEAN